MNNFKNALGINPYLPCTEFIPDGEPRIYSGRLYIYGSHDIYGSKDLCTGDYVLWSSPITDINDWRYEGVIFERMKDPFVKAIVESEKGNAFNQYLFAPDVIALNGKYYLYYGIALSGAGIGVAVSDKPAGPYEYLGRVHYPGCQRILGDGLPMLQLNPFKPHFGINMKNYPYDPSILLDNRRLFMYFGCGNCQMVELDPSDMLTIIERRDGKGYIYEHLLPVPSTKADKEKIAKDGGWHVANAPSIRKINGLYYLIYYAVNSFGGHALCYSIAKEPEGPFVYSGVLVSLGDGGLPGKKPTAYTGNTHGGLTKIEGRWYLCYHRQTGDKYPARQACMAELTMLPDGSFKQAEFLSQVKKEGGLTAGSEIPAYSACLLTDATGRTKKRSQSPYFTMSINEGKPAFQYVTNLTEGAVVGFRYVELPGRVADISVKMSNTRNGKIKVYINGTEERYVVCEILLTENTEEREYGGKITIYENASTNCAALYLRFFAQGKSTRFWALKITEDMSSLLSFPGR